MGKFNHTEQTKVPHVVTDSGHSAEQALKHSTDLVDFKSQGARVLMILETVAQSSRPVKSIDLAEIIDAPRATTHRLCVLLQQMGFLERELNGRRFVVGSRLVSLSISTLNDAANASGRHAILQSLANRVNETVNITVLDKNEAVYIDRVECQWPLRHHLTIGTRVPIHCGASGKLFLSFMPASERRKRISGSLTRYTRNSITDPTVLMTQLEKIRKSKVSIDDEEFMDGLIGLAVPIFYGNRKLCGTVSLHAPTLRTSASGILRHVPAMQEAATDIASTLQA